MQDLRSFGANPWLWAVTGLELAIWIGGTVTVVRANARKRAADRARAGAPCQIAALRLAYLAATGAVGLDLWYMLKDAMPALAHFTPSDSGAIQNVTFGVHGLLGLAFLTLIWRPYAWGKVLAGVFGLIWALFGLATVFLAIGLVIPSNLVSGLILLGAAIVHQVVDPRFGAGYLRATPSA